MRLKFDFFGVATGAASLESSPSVPSDSPGPKDIRSEERLFAFPNAGRFTTTT
jgi:hypothetical protein